MGRYCPIYSIKVTYMDCLDCEEKKCKNKNGGKENGSRRNFTNRSNGDKRL